MVSGVKLPFMSFFPLLQVIFFCVNKNALLKDKKSALFRFLFWDVFIEVCRKQQRTLGKKKIAKLSSSGRHPPRAHTQLRHMSGMQQDLLLKASPSVIK